MATTLPADVTSRAALKTRFADGARPTGADFGALIDSFVHRGDADGGTETSPSNDSPGGDPGPFAVGTRSFDIDDDLGGRIALTEGAQTRLALDTDGQWSVPAGEAAVPFVVQGWLGASARVGTYAGGTASASAFPGGAAVAPGKAPADGKWQVVLPALNGCCAFELVAQVSGAQSPGRHAVLHAIILTAFNGSKKGLSVTRTSRGWSWLRRLEVRWQPRRAGWFKRPTAYDLAIRTRFAYGVGDDGKPAQIHFHITRLW